MFISKKFSSTIAFSACSAALLTMVGCSNAGSDNADPSTQPQNQVMAAQNQAAAPSASQSQGATEFSGTTRGKVSAVNADGSVVVLGQTIVVSTSTVYFGVTKNDIMVGDYISVDSSVNTSGQVVAAAITLDTSFDPTVSLIGVVNNVDNVNQTFQVGVITVGFDSINVANFDSAGLIAGMVVEIVADEENFETNLGQVAVDSISVLEDGGTVNIGPSGVLVSDETGTVVVGENGVLVGVNGVIIDDAGDSVVVGTNGVSVDENGLLVVGTDGMFLSIDGDTVVVGENGVSLNSDGTVSVGASGVSVNDDNDSVVVDQNGVTINDEDGETSVTPDGITVDGVDLEDMINDTVEDTLNEILDLGDLNTYDYFDVALSSSTNCLSVGVPASFQITGNTTNAMSEQVTHNLSGQVSINTDSPDSLSLVANDSTGIYLNMNNQDIVEMDIVAGDTTLTHFVGAIPSSVERPVVLAKQTAGWCSFIVFEQDNCTSITNTTPGINVTTDQLTVDSSSGGATVTMGQTVVDTSSAGSSVTVDGELLIDTQSNQWLSEGGVVDSVSSHSGLTVSGCTLNNPENIPVITVD